MTERIILQGRAAELRENLKELELRADNHIFTIRQLIDPLDDFEKLKVDSAEQAMKSLKIIVTAAKEARKKLTRIEAELGL